MTDEIDEIICNVLNDYRAGDVIYVAGPSSAYRENLNYAIQAALSSSGYEIRKNAKHDGKEAGSINFGEANYGDLPASAAERQRKVGE